MIKKTKHGTAESNTTDQQVCYAIFHGDGGYGCEREAALKVFRVGGQYRIIGGSMGLSSTTIEIEGAEGRWNSVLFHYDHTIAPVVFNYIKYNDVLGHGDQKMGTKDSSAASSPAHGSEFSRPPKEVWRWYAWTRMKYTESLRWIATCWTGNTEEEAMSEKARALEADHIVLLVRERTTYTPNLSNNVPGVVCDETVAKVA